MIASGEPPVDLRTRLTGGSPVCKASHSFDEPYRFCVSVFLTSERLDKFTAATLNAEAWANLIGNCC